MKILSFDCALNTLGYCYVEIDNQKFKSSGAIITEVMNSINTVIGELKDIEKRENNNLNDNSNLNQNIDIEINNEIINKINDIIINVSYIIDQVKCIKFSGDVLNVMDGEKIKDVSKPLRARKLRSKLDYIVQKHNLNECLNDDLIVLIEIQPITTNFMSSTVADQISMYFAYCHVELVSASIKNTVNYTPELDYNNYEKNKKIKKTTEDIIDDFSMNKSKNYEKQARLDKVKGINYKSNKLHSRDNFLYAAQFYGFDTSHIPMNLLANCADAYQQMIAWLIRR